MNKKKKKKEKAIRTHKQTKSDEKKMFENLVHI
jgi:hypothetical protein